ncbi:hypothetical protein GJR96_16340 [Haloferax sp. MBLA0076]|uniref:Uncharacterized protein n=1 Tax=Haloferax litoreum TaxID=2666140 RepID=A0A6A8GNN7_9EURY|nr:MULTISPECIES: hypothetical protein [Haloferax]KAB1190537.1 hypothetical protein Hfx1148_16285 [Haloferax sp. CBA1148]MRX23520.1 hypothetical protein [Haloferax litoreum]
MSKSIDTSAAPKYDTLVAMLRDRFDDDLRWVASFDASTYNYTVHYIRPDLKTELSTHDFDVVVHRSIALFRRPYVEEVYAHLGDVNSLVLQHDRATAVHLYLTDSTGVIIKIKAGNNIAIPDFIDDCFAALFPGEAAN